MTHVVTDACVKCKHTDCAAVCPVDNCFVAGPNMLVIDPETCIDCGVCIPECPVDAILPDYDEFPRKSEWIALNAELAAYWGPDVHGTNEKVEPMDGHDLQTSEDRLGLVQREW